MQGTGGAAPSSKPPPLPPPRQRWSCTETRTVRHFQLVLVAILRPANSGAKPEVIGVVGARRAHGEGLRDGQAQAAGALREGGQHLGLHHRSAHAVATGVDRSYRDTEERQVKETVRRSRYGQGVRALTDANWPCGGGGGQRADHVGHGHGGVQQGLARDLDHSRGVVHRSDLPYSEQLGCYHGMQWTLASLP
jgi:hypothetical protein